MQPTSSPASDTDATVFFGLRELADALGVNPSAISHAVRQNHSVRSLYPVSAWAVRGDDGRVSGFDVPGDAADEIHAHAARRRTDEASAAAAATAHAAPVEPLVSSPLSAPMSYAPPLTRPDTDYERQREHFERVLAQRDSDVERHQSAVERLRDELDRLRTSRAEDLERIRTQLADERERHADERQELRDELAAVKTDLRAYEAGAPPESEEEDGSMLSVFQTIIEEYGPTLVPAVVGFLQRGGAAPAPAVPQAPPVASAPQPATAGTSTAPPPKPLPQQRAERLLAPINKGDANGLVACVREMRDTLSLPEGLAVGQAFIGMVRGSTPQAVGSWVKVALDALPELHLIGANAASEMAKAYGLVQTDADAAWLNQALLAAGIPAITPDDEDDADTETRSTPPPPAPAKKGRLSAEKQAPPAP